MSCTFKKINKLITWQRIYLFSVVEILLLFKKNNFNTIDQWCSQTFWKREILPVKIKLKLKAISKVFRHIFLHNYQQVIFSILHNSQQTIFINVDMMETCWENTVNCAYIFEIKNRMDMSFVYVVFISLQYFWWT